jgi:hypothetical protein
LKREELKEESIIEKVILKGSNLKSRILQRRPKALRLALDAWIDSIKTNF